MTIKKKFTAAMLSMILTAYAAALIAYSAQMTEDIRSALMRCINVIIPSLFAFMAVSDLIVRSGAYIFISKLFSPLAKIIDLPAPLFFAFLISNTAGYPVGAAMISQMCDSGETDKKSASRLLCCCYNGGPAFFSGAVGLAVFSSAKTGLMIYCSILLANVTAAAILNRMFPIKYTPRKEKSGFKGEMISDSVAAAGESILKICGMILVFQTAVTLLEGLFADTGFFYGNNGRIVSSFLEISNLSELEGLPYRLLPFIAAAGALGGICVIMQVSTVVKGRFSLVPFVFARIFCAMVAGIWCMILDRFFGNDIITAAAQTKFIVNFNNFVPSVCLIMMIFLTVLRKRLAFCE